VSETETATAGGRAPGRRVALVTGAGRGIGRAIARRLAADGHLVAVNDLDEVAARAVSDELNRSGGHALPVPGDISRADGVAAVHGRTLELAGAPDILVNNAGVISVSRFVDLPETEWDRILDVNLKGPYLCSQAVVGAMANRGWGRIVNIASDAGKTGEPWIAHYCASKFGVIGLTQSLALEFAGRGVTVNAVCPAICATDMMERLAGDIAQISGDGAAEARAALTAEVPMGRAVDPVEVADTVGFLVEDRSGFISGQAINVSGGHEVH
jgi:NAD(P)-dependent dehydrogenase (short-subunit alcohol dehydrogenase family)